MGKALAHPSSGKFEFGNIRSVNSNTSGLKVSSRRKEVKLKNFDEQDVDALYFNTETDLRTAAEELGSIAKINF